MSECEEIAATLEELKEKIAAALRERDAQIEELRVQRDALRQIYERAIFALNDRMTYFPGHRAECKPGKCVCGHDKARAALVEAVTFHKEKMPDEAETEKAHKVG